jgi:CBS domain-containing protein
MHPGGLVSCPADAPLRTVARMMATHRVHALLVAARGGEKLAGGSTWGIISDTELMRAARTDRFAEQPARTIAASPVLSVTTGQPLADAVELMVESGVAHLLVVDPRTDRPIGVLSTLDVARALADFPERHPIRP